jgi:septum formation protein
MSMNRLVLASTSPYRRTLIERLGLRVEVMAPDFDERAAEQALGPVSTADLAAALASGKARSLAATCPDALIIGADQIAELDGDRLHKPGSDEAAAAQLRRLAGRTHRLVTAVTVLRAADLRAETAVDVHELTMRPLSEAAIARYVERDRPLDCAGAYKIEALGIALFDRTSGHDFTAIVGLPLTVLVTLLARFGVDVLAA